MLVRSNDPDSAVLTRSFSSWSVMLLVPLTLAAIGAGGVIYNRPVRELNPRVGGTFPRARIHEFARPKGTPCSHEK